MSNIEMLGVRRWGEDDTTPIVIDGRNPCGTWSDHRDRGCIGLSVKHGGSYGFVHLTPEDALRLSDLLRAMTAPTTTDDYRQEVPMADEERSATPIAGCCIDIDGDLWHDPQICRQARHQEGLPPLGRLT